MTPTIHVKKIPSMIRNLARVILSDYSSGCSGPLLRLPQYANVVSCDYF